MLCIHATRGWKQKIPLVQPSQHFSLDDFVGRMGNSIYMGVVLKSLDQTQLDFATASVEDFDTQAYGDGNFVSK